MLKVILRKITKPTLFWLDAHYSGDGTARGTKDTPIAKELQSIFDHSVKNHVILIDDARDFENDPSYPSLEKLEQFVHSNSEYKMSVENDMILLTQR